MEGVPNTSRCDLTLSFLYRRGLMTNMLHPCFVQGLSTRGVFVLRGGQPSERFGLFACGSSAKLAMPILQSQGCDTYAVTRGESHGATANSLDTTRVGGENERPPVALDRAIPSTPSGKVIVDAL
jgi:hypothetical protein